MSKKTTFGARESFEEPAPEWMESDSLTPPKKDPVPEATLEKEPDAAPVQESKTETAVAPEETAATAAQVVAPDEAKPGKKKQPMVRISVDVPEELHTIAKMDCAKNKTFLGIMLRQHLYEKYNYSDD